MEDRQTDSGNVICYKDAELGDRMRETAKGCDTYRLLWSTVHRNDKLHYNKSTAASHNQSVHVSRYPRALPDLAPSASTMLPRRACKRDSRSPKQATEGARDHAPAPESCSLPPKLAVGSSVFRQSATCPPSIFLFIIIPSKPSSSLANMAIKKGKRDREGTPSR